MDELLIKLTPLSKLKIYQAIRKIVLSKMNNNEISPEIAKEIFAYSKSEIIKINSREAGQNFCELIIKKYPVLKKLNEMLYRAGLEKIDDFIKTIIELLMEKELLNDVDKILSEMEKSISLEDKKTLLQMLEKNYPQIYETALNKIQK